MPMESLDRTRLDPTQQAGPRAATEGAHELRRLGQFRILRRLGEGGMGQVYLAYHEGEDRQVALKVLSDQLTGNQNYVDRFYREAKSGTLLNHPNIVRCYGVGQDPDTGKHYLVLEYVDGPSALALLEHRGRLSVGDAVHIALDVARALEHAHSRNIIHRDIKPDNILVTASGVSKLADLGLAKRTDEASHLTAARQGFGTSWYMPYEQAVNARQADGRSDVYALGASLYHLLTGQVPFTGESHLDVVEKKDKGEFTPASALNPDVPPALDQILARMLERFPKERYQTASELIVDLERSRLAAPVPSYADPALAMQDPWVRQCIATSAQPTQPDLSQFDRAETPLESDGEPTDGAWIVRFRGKDARWRRVRMNGEQLSQRIAEGRVPSEAEVCIDPRQGFRPLREEPTFAAVLATVEARKKEEKKDREKPRPAPRRRPVEEPATPAPESGRSRTRLLIYALASALGIGLAVVLFLLFKKGR